jgi:hypothetical protein
MIAMPMPTSHHLPCFETWATYKKVCQHMSPAGGERRGQLIFGEEFGIEWEDLTPQVVWRGTDFSYLTKAHPTLSKPKYDEKMVQWPQWTQSKEDKDNKRIGGLTANKATRLKRRVERVRLRAPRRAAESDQKLQEFNKAAAVRSMMRQYDSLLPRWKAAVLTAWAEVQARGTGPLRQLDELPWANMKFSRFINGGAKTRASGSEKYKEWEDIGFATGEYMSLKTLAKFKYHIDLGGGGGTTWTGTVQKLAMPGLLFHHMTPTMDYIHHWMKPWTHYVPVNSDLKDLKRKFDWAEANPDKAKKIADAGTTLMRHLASPEGYGNMYQQDIVEPLRRIIEAYQPVRTLRHETNWPTYREAIRQYEGEDVLMRIMTCTGNAVGSCDQPLGRMALKKLLTHRTKRHLFGGS